MTIEALKSIYNARPFRAFIMHLADGRQFPVRHPEFLTTEPDQTRVTVHQPDGAATVVDLSSIIGLEIKTIASGSGERRKA